MAEVSPRCPRGGVIWITNWRRETDFTLCNGCHCHSSLILPGLSFCAIFMHSSMAYSHTLDIGNPTTTSSVSNLHTIVATTELHALSWYNSSATISAKCTLDRKPHANLPDTPVDHTSTSKPFQLLPGPPGAQHNTYRLCKRIFKCCRKQLQSWRCIQDATIFDL